MTKFSLQSSSYLAKVMAATVMLATSSASLAMEEVKLFCDGIAIADAYPTFNEEIRTFELNGVSYQNCSFNEVQIHCPVNRNGILEITLNRMTGVLSITKPWSAREARSGYTADGIKRRHQLPPPRGPKKD